MKNVFAFDIETIPNTSMIDRLPEVEPPKNLVDPAKIAAAIAKAKAEQVSKMALSPIYGRICAIVLISENVTSRLVIDSDSDLDEAAIVIEAFNVINKGVRLATWNGNGFDLPFIYKRAISLGLNDAIKTPLSVMTNRYDTSHHVDLMQAWTGNRAGEYAKLNDVAGAVLGSNKIEIDVTTFPELIKTAEGRAQLLDYCEQDVRLTFELFKRFEGRLF